MGPKWKINRWKIWMAGMLLLAACNSVLPAQNMSSAAPEEEAPAPSALVQTPLPVQPETANQEKSALPLYDPAKVSPSPTEQPVKPSPTKKPSSTPLPTMTPLVLKSGPYDEKAVPQTEIDVALTNAQTDGKRVLLDFGANWCPDCVVLSQLFEDSSVAPYLEENFYVVKVDVGNMDKNLDIVQKYENPTQKGIPAVVVLSPSGEILYTTADGALANARTATAADILKFLETWAAPKK